MFKLKNQEDSDSYCTHLRARKKCVCLKIASYASSPGGDSISLHFFSTWQLNLDSLWQSVTVCDIGTAIMKRIWFLHVSSCFFMFLPSMAGLGKVMALATSPRRAFPAPLSTLFWQRAPTRTKGSASLDETDQNCVPSWACPAKSPDRACRLHSCESHDVPGGIEAKEYQHTIEIHSYESFHWRKTHYFGHCPKLSKNRNVASISPSFVWCV